MAGDWIKVEEATPDKPEIAILARKLGVSQGDAFLEWFRVYRWAGRSTVHGLVPLLSLSDADMLSGARPGTCAALASADIDWLRCDATGIVFVKWDRHNGKSAKDRALEQEKKRRQRSNGGAESPELSRPCPVESGTKTGTRARGEQEEESLLLKSNGKSNGKPQGADRLPPLPIDASGRDTGDREPFDLSDLDWEHVLAMAETVARKIPPRSTANRRQWLKFGVMAEQSFGEAWLMDAVEAVLRAKETRETRQAHLMGVLKAKALDDHQCDRDTFVSMLRRIEIPADIWKSNALEVPA